MESPSLVFLFGVVIFYAVLSCLCLDVYAANLWHLCLVSLGEVWPGPCVFPDYTNSKTRSWWANLVKDFISNGVDGIWNDMNEPAVFNVNFVYFHFLLFSSQNIIPFLMCSYFVYAQTVTKSMPENNIHCGDNELGGVQNHSHYHNVFFLFCSNLNIPMHVWSYISYINMHWVLVLDYHRSIWFCACNV